MLMAKKCATAALLSCQVLLSKDRVTASTALLGPKPQQPSCSASASSSRAFSGVTSVARPTKRCSCSNMPNGPGLLSSWTKTARAGEARGRDIVELARNCVPVTGEIADVPRFVVALSAARACGHSCASRPPSARSWRAAGTTSPATVPARSRNGRRQGGVAAPQCAGGRSRAQRGRVDEQVGSICFNFAPAGEPAGHPDRWGGWATRPFPLQGQRRFGHRLRFGGLVPSSVFDATWGTGGQLLLFGSREGAAVKRESARPKAAAIQGRRAGAEAAEDWLFINVLKTDALGGTPRANRARALFLPSRGQIATCLRVNRDRVMQIRQCIATAGMGAAASFDEFCSAAARVRRAAPVCLPRREAFNLPREAPRRAQEPPFSAPAPPTSPASP